MSESSVKDILAKFNQGNGPQMGPRPMVAPKPGKPSKPANLAIKDPSSSNGTKPLTGVNGLKSPVKLPVHQVNIDDINKVKLKKPPLPRTPDEKGTSESPIAFKLQPKPKPKPVVAPRTETSPSSTPAVTPTHHHPKSPSALNLPPPPESFLHREVPSKPVTPGKKPKPPAPTRNDSLTKPESHIVTGKPSFLHPVQSPSEENKENSWRNAGRAEEPTPPLSDSENSSASSMTDLPPRRTSFLHDAKKSIPRKKPVLRPLPHLMEIGKAPRKPAKPPNVSLARFMVAPGSDSPPLRPPKPGSHSPPPPSLPARPVFPLGGGGKLNARPTPPVPPEDASAVSEVDELYDDVEGGPAPPHVQCRRPVSLIQTMNSDEEDDAEGGDIYDDAESTQAPAVPPHHPMKFASVDAPPIPSISSIPAYHGSGGSSVSFPRSAEHSGSGLEEPMEVYDDVSNDADGEMDELYEALDIDQESSTEMDAAREQEQRKLEERRRKEEEKLKREQEKQQKREEEKRKKKEREEKKRKEKEEKDLRKKFNLKGDINIVDEGIVLEAMDAVYEKLDLKCERGEKIEILRKEGNPPGKWLARNPGGHYGYVDHQFVRLEGRVEGEGDGDFGDVYDDVMAEDPVPQGDPSEDEEEDIYDAVD